MPDRSSIRHNRVGYSARPEDLDFDKDPAAVSLGRRGGLKGGKARALSLTAERRQEIARLAASARWRKKDE